MVWATVSQVGAREGGLVAGGRWMLCVVVAVNRMRADADRHMYIHCTCLLVERYAGAAFGAWITFGLAVLIVGPC
jgi:hypothetical protein